VKDQTYEETKSKHLQENDDEPIRGFRRLTPIDQAKLMAYMKENTEKSVDDERIGINDSHYQRKARMPEKEPSKKLIATLLPYQREALAWMCTQEKSIYGGGILADEMGMGKTLQAISVIVEKKRLTEKNPNTNLPHGGTLVVCPLVAVTQWKNEIEKFVEPGFLSIYIHHGSKRIICMETIAKYDIVITTYSILETEIRQSLMAKKIACQFCKKKFLPEKLIFHNKYFCGPNAQKTSKQKKQQTKAKTKTKTKAKVNVFVSKESEASDTSEEEEEEKEEEEEAKQAEKKKNTVATKNTQAKTKTTTTPLHLIFWTRIILDEAHYIKDRRSNTARGVFELKSQYKWCLTGTPLQNRIGELFSLIRFLQIKKYAYYHCRKCPCQILDFK
jgi:DNA repair protein RAD16